MSARTIGPWLLIATLSAILVASLYFAYRGMTFDNEFQMPTSGYLALWLGVGFSVVVGVGLMALMFFSSRAGYDEPAQRVPDPSEESSQRGEDQRQNPANAR